MSSLENFKCSAYTTNPNRIADTKRMKSVKEPSDISFGRTYDERHPEEFEQSQKDTQLDELKRAASRKLKNNDIMGALHTMEDALALDPELLELHAKRADIMKMHHSGKKSIVELSEKIRKSGDTDVNISALDTVINGLDNFVKNDETDSVQNDRADFLTLRRRIVENGQA